LQLPHDSSPSLGGALLQPYKEQQHPCCPWGEVHTRVKEAGERERERGLHFFFFGFPQSVSPMVSCQKGTSICVLAIVKSLSPLQPKRESGGGGMRPVPPPLPLLCSSVFLLLLLLCRPLAANGRTVRAEASSPGPLPHSVNGSIASSNGGAAAVRPANTASPPVGRSAAPSGVTGS
jgi:hypothetical protein